MIRSAASKKPLEFKQAFTEFMDSKKANEMDYYRFREGQRFLGKK
jgi:hypothetical protein